MRQTARKDSRRRLSPPDSTAWAFDQLLAEGLWVEWAPLGVDVLCLFAGVTDTPNLRNTGVDVDELAAMTADDARFAQ
jgi:hypothetical protein